LKYNVKRKTQQLSSFCVPEVDLIRLGLIGYGMAVQRLHLPALKHLRREIKVVAVVRRDYQEAKSIAASENIDCAYAEYGELLQDENVDAVLIALPIELNGTVLLDALHAGKHVMAEKPIAASLKQARLIVREAAKRQRQTVLIGENFRYRRSLAKAKELIDSGRIGDVFAFQLKVNFDITATARQPWISRGWRHEAKHAGGFILDAGVHPVAALRDLLGEVDQVWAQTLDVSSALNGPDSLLMQVRMKSGVTGQCFFCYTAKESRENALDFAVFGIKGVLRVGQETLTVTHGADRRAQSFQTKDREYIDQWKNFCAAIQGEETVVSTAAKAYGDLAVIDAALQSSANGKACSVSKLP
jgi:predicted dehydrogenase